MKKNKTTILAIAAALLTMSCEKEYEPKDKVEAAFLEYVRTDFDDPDTFLEITQREKPDTFSTGHLLELAVHAETYKDCFSEHTEAQYEVEKEKLIKEQPFFVVHPVKVRIGDKEEKRIQEFFVVEQKDSTLTVYDHYPKTEEVDETYADFAKTVGYMMDVIIKAMGIEEN